MSRKRVVWFYGGQGWWEPLYYARDILRTLLWGFGGLLLIEVAVFTVRELR
jgi:hypothetical protein